MILQCMPRSPLVQKACDYINSHPDQSLSVAEIADALGVHRVTLIRNFEKDLEVSPYEYIIAVKMKAARDLLRSGCRAKAQLTAALGYQRYSQFTERFAQHCGVSVETFLQLLELFDIENYPEPASGSPSWY